MEAEVKPRYDKKGSEFGEIHRRLPPQCCMFDIDKMSASAIVNLEITKQDIGFLEYRTNFDTAEVIWKALFEIKYKASQYVYDAINCRVGTSTFAQLKLCEKIGARYFIVVATNGISPFTFFEIFNDRSNVIIGTLEYKDRDTDGREKIREFWRDKLMLL